jgi:hypothetical protein
VVRLNYYVTDSHRGRNNERHGAWDE